MALREMVFMPTCPFLTVCAQLDPDRGPEPGVSWLHSIVPGAKKIVFSGDTGHSSSDKVMFTIPSIGIKIRILVSAGNGFRGVPMMWFQHVAQVRLRG